MHVCTVSTYVDMYVMYGCIFMHLCIHVDHTYTCIYGCIETHARMLISTLWKTTLQIQAPPNLLDYLMKCSVMIRNIAVPEFGSSLHPIFFTKLLGRHKPRYHGLTRMKIIVWNVYINRFKKQGCSSWSSQKGLRDVCLHLLINAYTIYTQI